MIKLLVGHRGTGKTSLLYRLKKSNFNSDWLFFDLDQEIELSSKRPLLDLYTDIGEENFRKQEQHILEKILTAFYQSDIVISLGAGFPLEEALNSSVINKLSHLIEIIWIQRITDLNGRIFLNRPRLNPSHSPLSEFFIRAETRNLIYQKFSHYSIVIPEGIHLINDLNHPYFEMEKKIVFDKIMLPNGSMTILPEMDQSSSKRRSFLNRYKKSGIQYFELRDDLIELNHIQEWLQNLSGEKIIFSFRKSFLEAQSFIQSEFGSQLIKKVDLIDWPYEFNGLDVARKYLPLDKTILSFHGSTDQSVNKSLNSFFDDILASRPEFKFTEFRTVKLSPLVNDWNQLFSFYQWQQGDPQHRVFLPRSNQGKWEWFRLFMRNKQMINFFSESTGSAADQPNILTWLLTTQPDGLNKNYFSGILGSPVTHSFTPIEQFNFFSHYQEPIYRIDLSEEEFRNNFLKLVQIGLRACAVTSPLKHEAYKLIKNLSAEGLTTEANQVHSVNTLVVSGNKLNGHNTDLDGLRKLFDQISPESIVAVWGGGGTLKAISQFFLSATFFSSRTGKIKKSENSTFNFNKYKPDVVVWAAPRHPDTQFPPPHWSPQLVIDLNYTENSMGREYALKVPSKYISGEAMFLAQGASQREYWRSFYER